LNDERNNGRVVPCPTGVSYICWTDSYGADDHSSAVEELLNAFYAIAIIGGLSKLFYRAGDRRRVKAQQRHSDGE
jgi:hypothetical protein